MPKKITQQEVISRAVSVHGDRYSYDLFTYTNMHSKSQIICSTHGIFEQSPTAHINQKQGCPVCGMKNRIQHNISGRLTTEQFIEEATKTHNNRYLYNKTEYKNATTPITITCPEHGDFVQRPTDHIHRRTGCPVCSSVYKIRGSGYGYYTHELFENNPSLSVAPGLFYFIEMWKDEERFLKVGVTKRTIKQRLWNSPGYQHEVIFQHEDTLSNCFNLEQEIIHLNKPNRFYSNNKEFVGRTELFKQSARDDVLLTVERVLEKHKRKR